MGLKRRGAYPMALKMVGCEKRTNSIAGTEARVPRP
nr:MAG TPA: hypothetical protein [Caudoviricetes sp.]